MTYKLPIYYTTYTYKVLFYMYMVRGTTIVLYSIFRINKRYYRYKIKQPLQYLL